MPRGLSGILDGAMPRRGAMSERDKIGDLLRRSSRKKSALRPGSSLSDHGPAPKDEADVQQLVVDSIARHLGYDRPAHHPLEQHDIDAVWSAWEHDAKVLGVDPDIAKRGFERAITEWQSYRPEDFNR